MAPAELEPEDNELLIALVLGDAGVGLDETGSQAARSLAAALDQALPPVSPATRADPPGPAPTQSRSQSRERTEPGVAAEAGQREALGPDDARLLELALELHAACGQVGIDAFANEKLIQRSLETTSSSKGLGLRWWTIVASVAAVAAGALVAVRGVDWADRAERAVAPQAAAPSVVNVSTAALIAARSTQALFDPGTKFPVQGGESERVDRIASARAGDLRANRFAVWGVR